MYIHTLCFTNTSQLSRAFELVTGSVLIEDCLVEPADLRLRFVAPADHATALAERIYLHGGLTWCQRHRFPGATRRPDAAVLPNP